MQEKQRCMILFFNVLIISSCRLACSLSKYLVWEKHLLPADHHAGWPLCKLWEHRFSVPDLVSPPPPPTSLWNIHMDGVPINQSNQSKSLGLIIDENLSWKAHIHEISNKVFSGIGALKRVRPFVSMHTAIKIYKGLIEPHVDHCSAVWEGLTQQLSEKLQKLSRSCYQSYH